MMIVHTRNSALSGKQRSLNLPDVAYLWGGELQHIVQSSFHTNRLYEITVSMAKDFGVLAD